MNETVLLSDPKSPLRVEYSKAAMEAIRERAREGLMAAPRVGMGVGGLLLGVREGGRTRIVDSLEIPCCHSGGPSFKLTTDEMQQAREMMAEAGEITAKTRVAVVGWYCSKTRGDAVLNEFDRQFHDELFPDAWQLGLVLRPSAAEPMRAVFYFRDDVGGVVRGVECEVEEWAAAEGESDTAEVAAVAESRAIEGGPVESKSGEIKVFEPPARPVAKVIEMSPPPLPAGMLPTESTETSARPQETKLADLIGASSAEGESPLRPRSSPGVEFFGASAMPPVKPPQSRQKWIIGAGAAALVLIAGGAWATRDSWLPAPPLNLSSSELNGNLLIRWNPDAVKGIDHGKMFVADGSGKPPDEVALDHFQLGSGLLNYALKTKQATATLDAGSVHDRTAWFAPPPASASPPASDAPAAAPSLPPPAAALAPGEKKPITTAPAQDAPPR